MFPLFAPSWARLSQTDFGLDIDALFESGLGYLLDGFHRATEVRFGNGQTT